jgi:isopentenyl phosphate kinase
LSASDGRVTKAFVDPIFAAVDCGLLPVVYGDVVLDRTRGALVVSTEALFLILAKEAARRKLRIARAVWLGETDGIVDEGGRPVAHLSAATATRTALRIHGASGVDVTGGMALRLRTAGALARGGVPSLIVNGRKPGAMRSSIAGSASGGTTVAAR